MSHKSAILILVAIAIIGSVFLFFMLKFSPPVTQDIDTNNIQTQEPDQTEPVEEKTPLTTQEKKERLNQIFEELDKDDAAQDTEEAEQTAAKTTEIFNQLNDTDEQATEEKTQEQIDQEKKQRLEDIFDKLNK